MSVFDTRGLSVQRHDPQYSKSDSGFGDHSADSGAPQPPVIQTNERPSASRADVADTSVVPSLGGAGTQLRVTVDDVDHPLYMVNNKFEIEWCNDQAAELLGLTAGLADDISDRNLFRLVHESDRLRNAQSWEEVISFHVSLAKNRLLRSELDSLKGQLAIDDFAFLEKTFEETDPVGRTPLLRTEANLAPQRTEDEWYEVFASFFREGIVFAYVPGGSTSGKPARPLFTA